TAPAGVIVISDSIVTIDPPADLPPGGITVNLQAGTFRDLAGNTYAGNSSDWSFTVDNTPPAIIPGSYSPANNAVNVPVAANLVFRFTEKVRKGTGNIVVTANGTPFETIPVGDARVTASSPSIPLLIFRRWAVSASPWQRIRSRICQATVLPETLLCRGTSPPLMPYRPPSYRAVMYRPTELPDSR
ncbi:MAG: Ig-like domain-containing protein, partial [Cytophagales bacterium]|nr:Ig-like domain-containing protein [Cytophagales bacterium]